MPSSFNPLTLIKKLYNERSNQRNVKKSKCLSRNSVRVDLVQYLSHDRDKYLKFSKYLVWQYGLYEYVNI